MMSFLQPLHFTTSVQRILAAGWAAGFEFGSNPTSRPAPSVKVLNGSYTGVQNECYNQDLFLGIPYAKPPVGDLRFRAPASLDSSWSGAREAVKYSDIVRYSYQSSQTLLTALSVLVTG